MAGRKAELLLLHLSRTDVVLQFQILCNPASLAAEVIVLYSSVTPLFFLMLLFGHRVRLGSNMKKSTKMRKEGFMFLKYEFTRVSEEPYCPS